MSRKYSFCVVADGNAQIQSNVVEAWAPYSGEMVKGVAKCAPEDTFDLEYGMKLASARCELKIADKRVKKASAKYNEARVEAEKAIARLEKMKDYFCDATDIYDEAAVRLAEIYNQI